ncbi:MAG: glycerophosphodiester phosphodiesterase [Archangiaceae bacterium]|nr:glycerophosphodiester phosphodiesterase [Archangiaceae bacterium]
MRILGHRGASADFPENTLEAFEAAVKQGADGIELDVMRCATGELVVCHDEWLDRLAGVHWEVAKTPWRKLKTADVGTRLGFRPARLPLLEEVLEAVPTHFFVNVELKCDVVDDHGLSVAVGQYLSSRRDADRVFVSSFNPLCLVRLARAFPSISRGFLIDPDRPWLPQAYGWLPIVAKTSVHPHFSACTPARVNAWHERHWQVAAWTVDDADEARSLRAMGVEWLITNRPAAMRAALSGKLSSG